MHQINARTKTFGCIMFTKKMQKTYTHKHPHNESKQTNNDNNHQKIIKKTKANQINKKHLYSLISRKRKRTNHFHNA